MLVPIYISNAIMPCNCSPRVVLPIARVNASWTEIIAPYNINVDATTSRISGLAIYNYRVYFNDVNGVLNFVDLTGTSDLENFNTNILMDWDLSGFAIVLKVTDTVGTDYTQITDTIDQQPFFASAYNGGFGSGYVFNF